MSSFTSGELAAATGGVWHSAPPPLLNGVFSDSRKVEAGALFVALHGDRFDGHDFVVSVMERGAAAALVESGRADVFAAAGIPVLAVEDTLAAYQSIAAFHRRRFPDLTVIGVTGSVGKTSTKEMLRAICAEAFGDAAVLATEGNTNNQIGVPCNLLRLNSGHRAAVIEMGTSSPGEIGPLSRIAAPRVAVVNAVAACHLEKLGDLDGVAREKGDIYSFCTESAVMPFALPQRPLLEAAARGLKIIFFGSDGSADVRCEYRGGNLRGSELLLHLNGGEFTVKWQLGGRHQALNAAAAAAAAAAAGIAPEAIARGLEHTALPGMRMKITEHGGVTFANDAYNANPESMRACLEHFAEFASPDKLILVLGDMLELGSGEDALHLETLLAARRLFGRACRILTVGSRMARAVRASGDPACSAGDAAAAAPMLAAMAVPGDLVLLKASRGTRLEDVLPAAGPEKPC